MDIRAATAELILASSSETRARMLRAAGMTFSVVAPLVDESPLKRSYADCGGATGDLAGALAELKARRVGARHAGAFVIGADQILDRQGERLDKPADRTEARAHLQALRGTTHRLVAAVAVVRDSETVWRHVSEARLTMRAFDDAFIEAYLDAMGDAVTQTVGGYRLEGLGARLFESVDGDFFTVLGLPLLPLLGFLRARGIVA